MSKVFSRILSLSATLLVLFYSSRQAAAQWFTQTIPLSNGWNGVQLLVQPAESDCAVIFSNTAVDKVYWWKRTGSGMEFDLDPRDPLPRSADWHYWFATNAIISSFGNLLAGESYSIYVAGNGTPFNVRVTGKPVLNPIRWIPGEMNLVGLPVSTNKQITFSDFFSFSPDFTINSSTATVYRINGVSGSPQRVWSPATEQIRGGEACWIRAGAAARDYGGPIQIETAPSSRLLDFGTSMSPRLLILKNRTSAKRTVRIEHLASEAAPAKSGAPALLGKTPLIFKSDAFGPDYQPLPGVLVTNIPASGQLELSLAPDSQSLTGGVPGKAWQSIIRVTDANNIQFTPATVDLRLGVSCDGSLSSQLDPAGLWVGNVTVTHVERAPTREGAENVWINDGPVSVSEPYTFRILMHVDAAGTPLLLQRALLAYQAGADATNSVQAIMTDEAEAMTYAARHPGAKIVRVSSTCFPMMAPLPMSGAFGAPNTLTRRVEIPYNDPVNPFVHRYHPQHDNLRYDNGVATNLLEGVESYTITRDMSFRFALLDPVRGLANRQWGVKETGGVFEETVMGLNKTIRIKGSFKIERVSRVSELGAIED